MSTREERKREFREELLALQEEYQSGIVDQWMSLTFDPADPWGSVMGTFFAVATVMYVAGARIPSEWEFNPGAGASPSLEELANDSGGWGEEDREFAQRVLDGELSPNIDLRTLGNFLHEASERAEALRLNY